jgi:hypothetical protein
MILEFVQAIVALFLLMAFWLGVQQYVRKREKFGSDKDVLEHITHGCGSCENDVCSLAGKQHDDEECAPAHSKSEVIQITPARGK